MNTLGHNNHEQVKPDTPPLPDVPDIPDIPSAPDTPPLLNVPDVPDIPSEPDTPPLPDVPDISESTNGEDDKGFNFDAIIMDDYDVQAVQEDELVVDEKIFNNFGLSDEEEQKQKEEALLTETALFILELERTKAKLSNTVTQNIHNHNTIVQEVKASTKSMIAEEFSNIINSVVETIVHFNKSLNIEILRNIDNTIDFPEALSSCGVDITQPIKLTTKDTEDNNPTWIICRYKLGLSPNYDSQRDGLDCLNYFNNLVDIQSKSEDIAREQALQSAAYSEGVREKLKYLDVVINELTGTVQGGKGRKVAICNHLYFDPDRQSTYKIKCGSCGEVVKPEKSMVIDGKKYSNPGRGALHSVSAKTLTGLFFPAVCPECGAINCLSSIIRKQLCSNTAESVFRGEGSSGTYIESISTDRFMSTSKAGTRSENIVNISKLMWEEILQLNIENAESYKENAGTDPYYNTQEFKLSMFEIDLEDKDTLTASLGNVTDNAYLEAIKIYRNRCNVLDREVELGEKSKEDKQLDTVLTFINSKNIPNTLMNYYESFAGYIINTKTFQKLKELYEAYLNTFNKFSSVRAVYKMESRGEALTEYGKKFLEENNIPDTITGISEAMENFEKEYKQYLNSYNDLKSKMVANPRVFAMKNSNGTQRSLGEMVTIFNSTYEVQEFFDNVLREYLITGKVSNFTSLCGMRNEKGERIIKDNMFKKSGRNEALTDIINNEQRKINTLLTSVQKKSYSLDDGSKSSIEATVKNTYQKDPKSIFAEFFRFYEDYKVYERWMTSAGLEPSVEITKTLADNPDVERAITSVSTDSNTTLNRLKGLAEEGGHTLTDMRPTIKGTSLFNLIFKLKEDEEDVLIEDAQKLFNTIFNDRHISTSEYIFSVMVVDTLGWQEFLHINDNAIANNLEKEDCYTLDLYRKAKESLNSVDVERCVVVHSYTLLANHRFVWYQNNDIDFDVLQDMNEDGDVLSDATEPLNKLTVEPNSLYTRVPKGTALTMLAEIAGYTADDLKSAEFKFKEDEEDFLKDTYKCLRYGFHLI